jgi:hypothetical protein
MCLILITLILCLTATKSTGWTQSKTTASDVITLTSVLHHLKSPIAFLNRAASKLKSGGKVIATEPFFSTVSTLIFKYLHHESVDFRIAEPELAYVEGPLASANIALPWLIFFRRPDWLQRLNDHFDLMSISTRPFSALVHGYWWNIA